MMPNNNLSARDFGKTVDSHVKLNNLIVEKNYLEADFKDEFAKSQKLLKDADKNKEEIEVSQLKIKQIKGSIDKINDKINKESEKLKTESNDLSIYLQTLLLKPTQIFLSLQENKGNEEQKDFLSQMIALVGDLRLNLNKQESQKLQKSYGAIKDLMSNPVIATYISNDVDSGTTIKQHTENVLDVVQDIIKLDDSKQKKNDAELRKSKHETDTLKASTHAELLAADITEDMKSLINLDGDTNTQEINITLTNHSRNTFKLAKGQEKRLSDDSSVLYAGERFVGYNNVELLRAYNTANKLGISEEDIFKNITKSIVANRSGFENYLLYRYADKSGKKSKLGEELTTTLHGKVEGGPAMSMKDSISKMLIQIYLVDYIKQTGNTPFDVMNGNLNEKIEIMPKGVIIPAAIIGQNSKNIETAVSQTNKETQDKINKLTAKQRQFLDLHFTGLMAYYQQNNALIPKNSVDPEKDGVKGTPIENGLYNYGSIETTQNIGTVSVGVAVTLLERAFDNNSTLHIDLGAIGTGFVTDKGSFAGADLFVGPNGSYGFNAGDNIRMNVNAFAGTSLSNLKLPTVGGSVGASIDLNKNSEKIGGKQINLDVSAGGGLSSNGLYGSLYVGLSQDRIKSIEHNADLLSKKFAPLFVGIGPTSISSLQNFKSYLNNKEKTGTGSDSINVARKYQDDLYALVKTVVEMNGGIANINKTNLQSVFAIFIKDIYTHNESLDLSGTHVDGAGVDLVRLLNSTNVLTQLQAVFGILKINKYRTLVTHSGQYNLSQQDTVESKDTLENINKAIVQKYNNYLSSVVGMSTEPRITMQGENIFIPKHPGIKVDGKANVEKTIYPGTQLSMIVFTDHVEITTKTPDIKVVETATETIKQSENDIFAIPATTGVAGKIDNLYNVNLDLDVQTCDGRKQEPSFEKMYDEVVQKNIKEFNAVKDLTWTKAIAYIKPYANDLKINADTKPITLSQLKSWLNNPQSYRENYDNNVGGLNAWMLAKYASGDYKKAYDVYSQLVRYETIMSGSFLEKVQRNGKDFMRVTQRSQNLSTRLDELGNQDQKEELKTIRANLSNKMATVDYQSAAQYDDAVAFTWGYEKDHYTAKSLDTNIFISKTNKPGHSFEDTFVHEELSGKALEYAKAGLQSSNPEKIKLLNDKFLDQYITSIKSSYTKDGKTFDEQKLSLTYPLFDAANAFDDNKLEITVKDSEGKLVNTTTIQKESKFYMVGNWQCAANETFVYVPHRTPLTPIKPNTPHTPTNETPTPTPTNSASVQLAQEIMQTSVITRNGFIGLGGAQSTINYNPQTNPNIYKPETTPDIDKEGGTPITNQGGSQSNGSGGFGDTPKTPQNPTTTGFEGSGNVGGSTPLTDVSNIVTNQLHGAGNKAEYGQTNKQVRQEKRQERRDDKQERRQNRKDSRQEVPNNDINTNTTQIKNETTKKITSERKTIDRSNKTTNLDNSKQTSADKLKINNADIFEVSNNLSPDNASLLKDEYQNIVNADKGNGNLASNVRSSQEASIDNSAPISTNNPPIDELLDVRTKKDGDNSPVIFGSTIKENIQPQNNQTLTEIKNKNVTLNSQEKNFPEITAQVIQPRKKIENVVVPKSTKLEHSLKAVYYLEGIREELNYDGGIHNEIISATSMEDLKVKINTNLGKAFLQVGTGDKAITYYLHSINTDGVKPTIISTTQPDGTGDKIKLNYEKTKNNLIGQEKRERNKNGRPILDGTVDLENKTIQMNNN